MSDELKINSTHLVVLKKTPHEEGVSIDYIPLLNPMRALLDRTYKKCNDGLHHKEYPNEIIESDKNLRNIFLSNYDFCWEISGAYQGLENLSNYIFEYDDELSEQKIKEKVLDDKLSLKHQFLYRDLAYMLELAYDKAKDNSNILAMSHRSHGWGNTPFKLTKNLEVEFKTNFGYGRKSYFYAKLRFKDIDIIPFSEWVTYKDRTYDEIVKYSQRYTLENQNWKTAMEYVRDAINLSIDDDVEFVEKYIVTECKWLIKGLKGVCNVEKPTDLVLSRIKEKRARIEYKGKKLSGSLDFIKSIAEYELITSVGNFINDLEQLCEDEITSLLQEYKDNDNELKKAVDDLKIETPKFEKLQVDSNNISGTFLPLQKKYIRIVNLYERITQYQTKNSDTSQRLQELFNIKYHDYGEIEANYLEIKPKYEEIQTKYSESHERYLKVKQLIVDFSFYERSFKRYIKKIDDHLHMHRKNYQGIEKTIKF